MRKKMILSWIFVFLWMILIFLLSDMTGTKSHELSKGNIENTLTTVIEKTNDLGITKPEKNQTQKISDIAEFLNYPIRKGLHVTEYFILTLLLYHAFHQSGVKNKKAMLFSLLICFLYACSDEFHQLFRQRTSHFSDVVIDTCGGMLAIFFLYFRQKKKKINNFSNLKKF